MVGASGLVHWDVHVLPKLSSVLVFATQPKRFCRRLGFDVRQLLFIGVEFSA